MICNPCKAQTHESCVGVTMGDPTWCDCQHEEESVLRQTHEVILPGRPVELWNS